MLECVRGGENRTAPAEGGNEWELIGVINLREIVKFFTKQLAPFFADDYTSLESVRGPNPGAEVSVDGGDGLADSPGLRGGPTQTEHQAVSKRTN